MDYTSAADVLAAIDRLDADVAGRLDAIARAQAAAASFAASAAADRQRRRQERARLVRRLRLQPAEASAPAGAAGEGGLRGLREAQQALVHAHAEGLPALRDAWAVDLLARHLVDLAAQLTVIDLWIEAEDAGAEGSGD